MTPIQRALALREGGQTQRCHTMPYIGPYNVAMHSYNALSLLLTIYPTQPSLELVKAVLWHDVPERWTGDVPTPAKMSSYLLKQHLYGLELKVLERLGIGELFINLTATEKEWLDAVDLLELLMWGREQEALGNTTVRKLVKQIYAIFETRKDQTPLMVLEFIEGYVYSRMPECHELIANG